MGNPTEPPRADADDLPVTDEPARPERSADPEVPEADALDQATEVAPGWRVGRLSQDLEVPEADAIDQAMEVPDADEVDY